MPLALGASAAMVAAAPRQQRAAPKRSALASACGKPPCSARQRPRQEHVTAQHATGAPAPGRPPAPRLAADAALTKVSPHSALAAGARTSSVMPAVTVDTAYPTSDSPPRNGQIFRASRAAVAASDSAAYGMAAALGKRRRW